MKTPRIILLTLIVITSLPWIERSFAAELPPRPPAVLRQSAETRKSDARNGSRIELVAPGLAHSWTAVEWQDADGHWRTVEGWQGHLRSNGRLRWWVDPDLLGAGPFRWVIYSGTSAEDSFTTTEPFNLPGGEGTILEIAFTSD